MYIANLDYATEEFLRERILTGLPSEFSRVSASEFSCVYTLFKNCPF
jgi:hypothetical protein